MVQENCLKKVLVVCGPTASNKSALAIELAKLLGGEIICADSMTVYKGLDIGTAKITLEERQGIAHHMLDVASPEGSFSVGDYKELATPILKDIISRGKTAIICGGTGFYINSLLFEMSYGKSQANLETREKYKTLAEIHGKEYVYNILKEVDAVSAQKLHYNDIKRVVRALEIYESGFKKSDIKDDNTPIYDYQAYSYDFLRSELYDRIEKRVDIMFASGLVDEVKGLVARGITDKNQSMQGIGYKEIYAHITGQYSLQEAVDLIKLNTRHYAKRQITFFKKLPNLTLLAPENPKITAKRILNEL